jgi:SAM-dependent methyltransferase
MAGATSVEAHYRDHLGPVYDWMLGDFDVAAARSESQLRAAGLGAGGGALAIDLGCGSGLQTIPLLHLGWRVLAIDSCALLLDRLRERARGLPLQAIEGDLRDFPRHQDRPAAAIVCMGDTFSHLPSRADVRVLLAACARALSPGGGLVLGFRDLSGPPPRFVPVRSDDRRILTAVLEEDGEHLVVHDLLHERGEAGWTMSVSSYRKIRLPPAAVRADAVEAGLEVTSMSTDRGLVTLVARRP